GEGGGRVCCRQPAPQQREALYVVLLLVPVEGGGVIAGGGVEHGGNPHEPIEVGGDVAANLQFVVAPAVVGDGFLQRFRQPVVDALARLLIGGGDRVHEPNGVAHGDIGGRMQGR